MMRKKQFSEEMMKERRSQPNDYTRKSGHSKATNKEENQKFGYVALKQKEAEECYETEPLEYTYIK